MPCFLLCFVQPVEKVAVPVHAILAFVVQIATRESAPGALSTSSRNKSPCLFFSSRKFPLNMFINAVFVFETFKLDRLGAFESLCRISKVWSVENNHAFLFGALSAF